MSIARRLFTILLGVSSVLPVWGAEGLTSGERQSLIEQLEASAQKFEASIANVPEDQWNQKPGPDRWSVAEVSEHIALSDALILSVVRDKVMKSPEQPANPETRALDAKIRPMLLDRSGRFQAPEPLKPTNRWPTKQEVLSAFRENRAKTMEYVKTTDDALRAHAAPHPLLKTLDGYQWLLLLSAHTERHTLQIEEAKAALKAAKKP